MGEGVVVNACGDHSGICEAVATLKKADEDRKDEIVRIWKAIEGTVSRVLFNLLVVALIAALGTVFGYQVKISTELAVIRTEIGHINQVKASEDRIIKEVKKAKNGGEWVPGE